MWNLYEYCHSSMHRFSKAKYDRRKGGFMHRFALARAETKLVECLLLLYGKNRSRKNYFEIPPCRKMVIFVTKLEILRKTPK